MSFFIAMFNVRSQFAKILDLVFNFCKFEIERKNNKLHFPLNRYT